MYLIDTNIWLELLLDQDKASEVKQFFNNIDSNKLFISDFSFHSICLILTRLDSLDAITKFVHDTFVDGMV